MPDLGRREGCTRVGIGMKSFPLPTIHPVPLSRFTAEDVAALGLKSAALMPDGDIWAFGSDGATYRFPGDDGVALADALLDGVELREKAGAR